MLPTIKSQLRNVNYLAFAAFAHDVAAAGIAWLCAYWLRFNLEIPAQFASAAWTSAAIAVPIQAAFFWLFGLYRGIWRFASLPDLRNIVITVSIATLGVFTALLMLGITGVPRSVALLDPLVLIILMGGNRALYRGWKDREHYDLSREPVIILGAGAAAAKLIGDIQRHPKWRIVALLDDDPRKHNRSMYTLRVLGNLASLPFWASKLDARMAIIAIPSMSPEQRYRAVRICEKAGVKALSVPALDELISGETQIAALKEVQIDDLLGRNPVELDIAALKHLLTDKVVLVSGAGGSIGSELCRQILHFRPKRLVLLELSEFALYRIEQELSETNPEALIDYLMGDVRNKQRLDEVMAQYQPNLVFHAAAYKHVPLMESANAWEAIQNNVLGTYCLAMASLEYGVQKFVLISTDKAVNPTNVMGASKRMAELVCQSLQGHHDTEFVIVRFGNVLGSNGSVVPKFREQIARGGPITVTHPDITRFFMSISEAAQLVLQAGQMGKHGEIFVLDMGKAVKVVDLAREMIRLSGFNETQIPIQFTGLRPGEKLFEELLADGEQTLPTPHPKLRIAKSVASVDEQWLPLVAQWLRQERRPSEYEVKSSLQALVAEYHPSKHSNIQTPHNK